MIPSWILDIFAAIMLVVAAVSAARLVAARPWQHRTRPAALADIDVAHLLMAIAMAGTLAPGLRTLPDAAWEVIFGVMTAWFAYRVARDARVSGFRALAGGHCAPHLLHAGAMLYMFVAVSAPAAHGSGGMGAMGGGVGGMGTLDCRSWRCCSRWRWSGTASGTWTRSPAPAPAGTTASRSPAWRRPARYWPGSGRPQPGPGRPARRRRGRGADRGAGRARSGAAGQRPGGRHRRPRPVGGDGLPDRDGRHHGVHAGDHEGSSCRWRSRTGWGP